MLQESGRSPFSTSDYRLTSDAVRSRAWLVVAAVKLLVRIYMQFPHACADSWQAVADLGEGWVGGP